MTSTTFKINASLPMLVIPAPTCGNCDRDVLIEDGVAACEHCLIQWDRIDESADAEPDPNLEDSDVPCLIANTREQTAPYDYNDKHYELGPYEPCILPSGHDSDHLHPYTVTATPLTEAVTI